MTDARTLGLGALREANFRWLLGAQWASLIGDYMVLAALPFAVFAVGGSAAQVGLAFGVETVALVLLVLFGGVLGDRVSRRSQMVTADLLRFGSGAIFAALLITGSAEFWQLIVAQIVYGAGAAFSLPALSGLLPETVRSERLGEANALRGISTSSAAMIGPAVAGLIVATLGPGWVFAADAGSFALSAALLLMLRPGLQGSSEGGEGSVIADLAAGWAEFRRRTWLWAVVVEFAALNALVFAPFYVFGATVANSLGGPEAWALILGACGVGELLGGLVALSWRPRRPLLAATTLIAAWALPLLLLATLAPLGMIAVSAMLAGLGLALFTATWQTTLQSQVPAEQLSRLSSYDWMGSVALLPVGYVLVGFTQAAVGVQGGLLLAGAVVILATLAVTSVPSVRRLPGGGVERRRAFVPALAGPEA